MERLLTTWHCLDQHGSKTSLAREKIAQKVMCDAHQHCIFFAVPPPTKKGNTRAFARLCTFVHACNPPISKVPPGFPQLPVITQSNLQFSSTPSTLKYGILEIWQSSEISVRQFPPKRIIKQCPLQCIIQHVILCSWNQANARSWIFSKWSDAQFWLLHSSTTYSESWTSSAWTTSPLYPPTIRKT